MQNPRGSLFLVQAQSEILVPLAYENLAYPSGLALSADESTLYVAETCANRILRFVQSPSGVFVSSIFVQLSGMFGPTALCCDHLGNVYVARFDFVSASGMGVVSAYSPMGELLQHWEVEGSQVTGLCLSADKTAIIVTEGSNNAVYSININA